MCTIAHLRLPLTCLCTSAAVHFSPLTAGTARSALCPDRKGICFSVLQWHSEEPTNCAAGASLVLCPAPKAERKIISSPASRGATAWLSAAGQSSHRPTAFWPQSIPKTQNTRPEKKMLSGFWGCRGGGHPKERLGPWHEAPGARAEAGADGEQSWLLVLGLGELARRLHVLWTARMDWG